MRQSVPGETFHSKIGERCYAISLRQIQTLLGIKPAVPDGPGPWKRSTQAALDYVLPRSARYGLPSLQSRNRKRLSILPALRCEYNDGCPRNSRPAGWAV